MSKIKRIVLAVMFVGPAAWGVTSILSHADTREMAPIASGQVNTYELMSISKNLPVQAYETF